MKRLFFILLSGLFALAQAQQCGIIDAGDNVTLTPANNCTTLTGSFDGTGIGALTDTYTIENLTACDTLSVAGNPISLITTDDVWSDLINLPFDFEYFGNPYNSLIVGGNGVVSFDTNRANPNIQKPGEFCEWGFNDPLPSANLFMNTIFGAYHDMDVNYGGSIVSYLTGIAPARRFVVKFDSVAHFSCSNMRTTQYIILNETSNIIEVYIIHKDVCAAWNNGNAVLGIQNEFGDVAYVPTGRNTGPWDVQTPEYWRFVPATNPQTITPSYTWYDNATNVQVGTGLQVDVCVNQDTTYRLEATFNHPLTGQPVTISDTVTVNYDTSNGVWDFEKNHFQISPNPVDNTCVIKLQDFKPGVTIQLLDMSGKILRDFEARDTEITMDLSDLKKGVYLIQLHQNNQTFTSKLMKR